MKKQITEIKVLEAYLGEALEQYIAETDTNCYNRRKEIENIFKGISVDIDTHNEEGEEVNESFDITNKSEIEDLKDKVESLIWDLEVQYESRLYDQINSLEYFKELCDNLLYDYSPAYEIGCCIYNLSKQEGLNENHLQLAKNDKETFKTLIQAYK